MGRIATSDGREWTLGSIHIIGGDTSSDLVLHHPEVSVPHARLSWDGSGWEVRDLSSTNGTFVEGSRLEGGRNYPIDVGDVLRFGERGPEVELVDAAPPVAMLVDPRTNAEHLGSSSLLAWPAGDAPEVVIAKNAAEQWNAEWPSPGQVDPVKDRDHIVIDGRNWLVRLPVRPSRTEGRMVFRPDLRFATLEIRVPAYLEDIELRLVQGSVETKLGRHAQNYMLYRLATYRDRDVVAGRPEEAAGWVAQETLLAELNDTASNFYVAVHRIRTRLADAGVEQAGSIVERRRNGGQVRLGVGRYRIVMI